MKYPSAKHVSYGRANRVSYASLLFLTPWFYCIFIYLVYGNMGSSIFLLETDPHKFFYENMLFFFEKLLSTSKILFFINMDLDKSGIVFFSVLTLFVCFVLSKWKSSWFRFRCRFRKCRFFG